MRIRSYLFFLAVFSVSGFALLKAQDQGEPSLQWSGFQIQGSATAGYRFTSVKGYAPMFQELYNLNKGPRLMDFNLIGHSLAGTNSLADDFSFTTSGLGGDPFPSAQFTLSKAKRYDLRANWRQSYFYWNQNDGIILPTRGTTGLTDNHDWATVRKIGSVDLTLHATNNLRFNFQYYRTSFSGATLTTFSPAFFDSPDSLGGYARANAYRMYAPTHDNTQRFTGGIDYSWHTWSFHYNLGYQSFGENITFSNVTSPERAIDTTTGSTATTPLSNAFWTDFRQLTTPVSEFSYTGKPAAWLDMHGSYIFYRYRGPANIFRSFSGNNPDPYTVSENGRVNVSEPNDIVDQGFTFHAKPWWDIDLDYRYSRFTTNTDGTFSSLFDGVTPASGEVANDWKFAMHQLDFNMIFTPNHNLVIRPGVEFFKADVVALEDGVLDPVRTLQTKTVSPILSVFYRPSQWFSVRGELRNLNNGASYTAITPHTDLNGRVVASLRLSKRFSLNDELNIVNQQLLATDFHGKVRSNSTLLNFAANEHYSLFAGLTYDSEYAAGSYLYPRGTAPLSGWIHDQDVNRIWQAGFEANPVRYFGIRFTGNFVRATGVGQDLGENPVYGPLTWPLATGTVFFDFPKAGRLSVDLQRTYYLQQIITGNNFRANMLTLRWTKDF